MLSQNSSTENYYVDFMNRDLLMQFRGFEDREENGDGFILRPNTKAIIEALGAQLEAVLSAFFDIYNKTYFRILDESESDDEKEEGAHYVQLDGIGEIVGYSRKTASAVSDVLRNTTSLESIESSIEKSRSKKGKTDFAIEAGKLAKWIKTNFAGYVSGDVLDDEPYSRALDYKIFVNNAWCTYDDLMRSITQWWTDTEVGYSEIVGEDARAYLTLPDIVQNEDGTWPINNPITLFFMMPIIKAAGVELIRKACLIYNRKWQYDYVGLGLFSAVMETTLPYYVYKHKFKSLPKLATVGEDVTTTILPNAENWSNKAIFEVVEYGGRFFAKVNRKTAEFAQKLVFPSFIDGHFIDGIVASEDEEGTDVSDIYCIEIVIPSTYTRFESHCFEGYKNLQRFTVDNYNQSHWENNNRIYSLQEGYEFAGCESLKFVSLNVNSKECYEIGEGMFKNCKSLEILFIPGSVNRIYSSAFEGTNISTLYYGGTEEEFKACFSDGIIPNDLENTKIEFEVGR